MSNDTVKSSFIKTQLEYFQDTEKMLLKRGENPEIPIKTLPSLNLKLWGLKKGEVTIIGARTSNGKSAFLSQIVWDCALSNQKVLYLSLEMPVVRVIERMFCMIHKIDNFDLLRGKLSINKEYQTRWTEFKKDPRLKRIMFCDYIGKTWKEIDETIEKLKIKPDVVVIDHIHHIRAMTGVNEKQLIDEYLEHFREMTIRNDFVGILCAQINRTSQEEKEGEPQMHHLKATGKLEEIADNVLLLYWPWHADNKKPQNLYKINIAKNRYGATGRLEVNFEPKYYLFSDLPDDYKQEPIKTKKEHRVDWEE